MALDAEAGAGRQRDLAAGQERGGRIVAEAERAAVGPARFQVFDAEVSTIARRAAAADTIGNGVWVAPGKVSGAWISSASTSTSWRSASSAIAASAAGAYTTPVGLCGEHSTWTRAPAA